MNMFLYHQVQCTLKFGIHTLVHVSWFPIHYSNRELWTVHDSWFEKKPFYQSIIISLTPSMVPLPLPQRTTPGATPVLSQIASHKLLHSPLQAYDTSILPPPNSKRSYITNAKFFPWPPLWSPYFYPKGQPRGNSGSVANRIAYTATFTIIGIWHFNFATP